MTSQQAEIYASIRNVADQHTQDSTSRVPNEVVDIIQDFVKDETFIMIRGVLRRSNKNYCDGNACFEHPYLLPNHYANHSHRMSKYLYDSALFDESAVLECPKCGEARDPTNIRWGYPCFKCKYPMDQWDRVEEPYERFDEEEKKREKKSKEKKLERKREKTHKHEERLRLYRTSL